MNSFAFIVIFFAIVFFFPSSLFFLTFPLDNGYDDMVIVDHAYLLLFSFKRDLCIIYNMFSEFLQDSDYKTRNSPKFF